MMKKRFTHFRPSTEGLPDIGKRLSRGSVGRYLHLTKKTTTTKKETDVHGKATQVVLKICSSKGN